MSSVLNRQRASGSGAQGGDDAYVIENSLRFNPPDSAHMDLTFGTPTSQKKFTLSWWTKRTELLTNVKMFSCTDGNDHQMQFLAAGNLSFVDATGTVNQVTTQKFLDPTAWYHFVWSMDTSRGNGDRSQIFVNGVRITSFSTNNQPGSGADVPGWNSACAHKIGEDHNGGNFFNGLMAEIVWIDGQGLLATSFGEYDSNGGWRAISIADQSLTFGDNGYYLEMKIVESVGNGPGTDTSGEGNHWAASGIADNDRLKDTPADDADSGASNFATLSKIVKNSGTIGTVGDGGTVSLTQYNASPFGMISGKWYAEFTPTAISGTALVLLAKDATSLGFQFTLDGEGRGYDSSGRYWKDGAIITSGLGGISVNDVVSMAVDLDNLNLEFFINNSSKKAVTDLEAGQTWYFTTGSSAVVQANFGTTPITGEGGESDGNGFGDFKYAPPSGYLALCTANLPEPAIKDASAAMNAQTFTGTGSENARTFGGNTALSPNLAIVRDHSGSSDWNFVDTIRGATKELELNKAAAESTVVQGVKSFNADGVTLGSDAQYNSNTSANTLVGFKEGATEGFDIVTYTGNASGTQSISHNLGVKPGFIIVIRRDTGAATFAWHTALTGDNFNIPMSTTGRGTETSSSSYFAATHNASVFVVDNAGNTDGGTYVAYLYADVPQYQKHGLYVGNSSANGTFVYCGFRPRAIFIRRFDGERNGYWYDTGQNTFNTVTDGIIFGRDAVMETSSIDINILSNGFKLMVSAADINGAVPKNLFSAWAEAPFGGENVSQSRAR